MECRLEFVGVSCGALQCSTSFIGSALLDELRSNDKLTEATARAWVVRKTGHRFDPEAMYELRWQTDEDSPTWSGYVDMHVHIMTDLELMNMEREYRRQHRLPQRRPWEPPMFQAAMGRWDGSGGERGPGRRTE
jgi:hypothetical protein